MHGTGGLRGAVARVWRWIQNRIAQPVPPDLAECEFHCDRPDCRADDWERCENRKAHEAWARERASRS